MFHTAPLDHPLTSHPYGRDVAPTGEANQLLELADGVVAIGNIVDAVERNRDGITLAPWLDKPDRRPEYLGTT